MLKKNKKNKNKMGGCRRGSNLGLQSLIRLAYGNSHTNPEP